MKTGDVVTRLGEHNTPSLAAYMQALSKFKKGQQTQVTIKRGNEELKFDIVF